jgi:poly(3-hydroxyalkanoate) synthetase
MTPVYFVISWSKDNVTIALTTLNLSDHLENALANRLDVSRQASLFQIIEYMDILIK